MVALDYQKKIVEIYVCYFFSYYYYIRQVRTAWIEKLKKKKTKMRNGKKTSKSYVGTDFGISSNNYVKVTAHNIVKYVPCAYKRVQTM